MTSEAQLRNHPWKRAYGPQDRPLEAFYLPALSLAVRYDRVAGFFSSTALSVAAQGVAALVARGGRMRLLVGAQLSQEDVEAVLKGVSLQDRLSQKFLAVLQDPSLLADYLLRERLKVLAWLVAHGRLEVRVAVEAEPVTGRPMASQGYFHAKGGVLWDEVGDGIAFVGSINETATAWRNNYERFHVFCSWQEGEHFREEAEAFERLWEGAEPGWKAVPLPQAVHERLIKLAPPEPPTVEPALRDEARKGEERRWLVSFLRDAPYLVNYGWHVGVETARVEPFPHQRAVAYEFLDRFPCRRLLADEVGLGKTIEAGLILRSLLLSGWVKRCLILVPRSLVRQWQEELRDRFLIEAPFYDGRQFLWLQGCKEPAPSDDGNPWDVHPVVIASAQMAKRKDRAETLLAAERWDLVIVDEAHHARRRDFQDLKRYRPNLLLQLLEALTRRTRALLLLTATPMQVHPVEVWDFLKLLGLPGPSWQDQRAFLSYFEQFRLPFDEIQWAKVLPLLKEAVDAEGWDQRWLGRAEERWGPVVVKRVVHLVNDSAVQEVRHLGAQERECLQMALAVHNPLRRLMYRHTRELLRRYYQRGLLNQPVPRRKPSPQWLTMSRDEERLYREVERYIIKYYHSYEEVERGLGFVMTIYRRRLTSSLYALRRSLERRLSALRGQTQDQERPLGLEDEDVEEWELSVDPEDWDRFLAEEKAARLRRREETYLEGLLKRLAGAGQESKVQTLLSDLERLLSRAGQVIVFTQYTDTMDFLREQLRPKYGSLLACYSGRGGEMWDPVKNRWTTSSKEQVQDLFMKGRVRVLLCTEAGGEGLNLQSCGIVINYDMPWNPMKVEQRIGRIDRVGQRRPEIEIYHYFYEGTVEAEVYRALGERIGWFETVVGKLQPIIQEASRVIQEAAMEDPDRREGVLRKGLHQLTERYKKELKLGSTPLEDWSPGDDPPEPRAPVTWRDLHDEAIAGLMDCEGQGGSATDGATYGEASWHQKLQSQPDPPLRSDIVRMEAVKGGVRVVGYYRYDEDGWKPISSLRSLREALERRPPTERPPISSLQERFSKDLRRCTKHIN